MKTVCSQHHVAYDVNLGCTYCPPMPQTLVTVTGPMTATSLYRAVQAKRGNLVGARIHVNEKTYRAFSDGELWVDALADIHNGEPVPPCPSPVAMFFGGYIIIDPQVADDSFTVDP